MIVGQPKILYFGCALEFCLWLLGMLNNCTNFYFLNRNWERTFLLCCLTSGCQLCLIYLIVIGLASPRTLQKPYGNIMIGASAAAFAAIFWRKSWKVLVNNMNACTQWLKDYCHVESPFIHFFRTSITLS